MNHEQQQQQNLELVLNNIASPEARTYLRTAVAELLELGFTHCSTDGWMSPLQRQPHQPLSLDAARLLLHAAALELSRSGKITMGQVVSEAAHVVAPLKPAPSSQEADEVALAIAMKFMPVDAAGEWSEGQRRAALQAAIAGAIREASRPAHTLAAREQWTLDARPAVSDQGMFTFGIRCADHWSAIECHGSSRELAQSRAEAVMAAYTAQPAPVVLDLEHAHQLAAEIAGYEGGYMFNREELEHFLELLLAVKS